MAELRAAIAAAARNFAEISPTPRLDAELLMAHALGTTREALLLRHLDDAEPAGFAALVARRRAHEPVAYITGRRDFWTISLIVGPGVLIPRPDSETLIEAAVGVFGSLGPARVLDLGTGPGTLLLAALAQWPRSSGIGIDASAVALDYARRNAEALGLADRAQFRIGYWGQGLAERFDLILANPPYVGTTESLPREVAGHEPSEALYAGADGLADYRRLLPQLPRLLAASGRALVEIGAEQSAAVLQIGADCGLSGAIAHDLGGRPRALVFRDGAAA